MTSITEALQSHYRATFLRHGATSKGVDWGKESDVELRHSMMLNLMTQDPTQSQNRQLSLLDVGCGYGAFLGYANARGMDLRYTGIDLVGEMINYGKEHHQSATFLEGDFMKIDVEPHDYVICNGILTQKLTATIPEMDEFANGLVRRMFANARRGIAFNVMSTKVNFMVENLYYRHPMDMIGFCLNELSPKVRLDHAYPLYEYTVYVYRQ
jgi:SAM-dependent methyltransferase